MTNRDVCVVAHYVYFLGLSQSLRGGRRGGQLKYVVSLIGVQAEIWAVDKARVLTFTSRCSVITYCLPFSKRVLCMCCNISLPPFQTWHFRIKLQRRVKFSHNGVKRKVVPVLKLIKHHAWRYGGVEVNSISDLGARWRWVVSFTCQPLYPREKRTQCPLDNRLGGPQGWSGRYGEETFPLPGIELRPPRP
jgi:hypothetical protein